MSENIEIIPGTTPWVEVPDLIANNVYIYPFCQSDAFVKNYGKADKVLYMPNIYPVNQPYLNIYNNSMS